MLAHSCATGRQRGFSLMELMVGITIGLLVVIAATGSLVYTQITSTVVGDSTRLQQKADAIFRNMGFQITQSSARNLTVPNAGEAATVVFSSAFAGFNGTGFSVQGSEGAINAPDTLQISYQDDGVVHDCLGNRPDAASTLIKVDNQFSLSNGNLMCAGANAAAAAQSIGDGVEDFQVTYGILTGTGSATAFQFLNAGSVTNWGIIQAVSVCLQLTGDNVGNPQTNFTFTGCQGQIVNNDGRLRRLFRRTFALRNALL